jgi:hypothetical protein
MYMYIYVSIYSQVNLLGGYDSAIKHMEGDGIKRDQIPVSDPKHRPETSGFVY